MRPGLGVVLAVALVATACGGSGDTSAGSRDKIGYLTSFGTFGRDAYAYVAQEKGFFAEAGYGSTSGRFDLKVSFDGAEILDRVVGSPGEWLTIELPGPISDQVHVLEFSGHPLPGPPLRRRAGKAS